MGTSNEINDEKRSDNKEQSLTQPFLSSQSSTELMARALQNDSTPENKHAPSAYQAAPSSSAPIPASPPPIPASAQNNQDEKTSWKDYFHSGKCITATGYGLLAGAVSGGVGAALGACSSAGFGAATTAIGAGYGALISGIGCSAMWTVGTLCSEDQVDVPYCIKPTRGPCAR